MSEPLDAIAWSDRDECVVPYVKNYRVNGLSISKDGIILYVHSLWHNTGVRLTDRQTDRNALTARCKKQNKYSK